MNILKLLDKMCGNYYQTIWTVREYNGYDYDTVGAYNLAQKEMLEQIALKDPHAEVDDDIVTTSKGFDLTLNSLGELTTSEVIIHKYTLKELYD